MAFRARWPQSRMDGGGLAHLFTLLVAKIMLVVSILHFRHCTGLCFKGERRTVLPTGVALRESRQLFFGCTSMEVGKASFMSHRLLKERRNKSSHCMNMIKASL